MTSLKLTRIGITLTPHDPIFADQLEAARKIMKRRRRVLHELAK